MLTVRQVRRKVGEVRRNAGDFEAAHAREDDLHQEVLRAIASGDCEDPRACAAEALRTLAIKFRRAGA